jgi:phenylalanyl-tRNA synthetase beta chain
VDLADLAGIVDALATAVAPGARLAKSAVSRAGLHPGRSIAWSGGGRVVAMCGELHPDLRERLDLGVAVQIAEVDLDGLAALRGPETVYRAVSRFPAVSRDLSLLGRSIPYGSLVEALSSIPAPAPCAFELLDRYEGPPLEDGQVSMTVRVILQPVERTLTDAETEGYRARLVEAVERALPLKLRSGRSGPSPRD